MDSAEHFRVQIEFASPADHETFVERYLGRTHGCHVGEAPAEASPNGAPGGGTGVITISSPSAARGLCSTLVAWVHERKLAGIGINWMGTDGSQQTAVLREAAPAEAERAAMRLAASVKQHQTAQRAAGSSGTPQGE